jgi:hypothetical protein
VATPIVPRARAARKAPVAPDPVTVDVLREVIRLVRPRRPLQMPEGGLLDRMVRQIAALQTNERNLQPYSRIPPPRSVGLREAIASAEGVMSNLRFSEKERTAMTAAKERLTTRVESAAFNVIPFNTVPFNHYRRTRLDLAPPRPGSDPGRWVDLLPALYWIFKQPLPDAGWEPIAKLVAWVIPVVARECVKPDTIKRKLLELHEQGLLKKQLE